MKMSEFIATDSEFLCKEQIAPYGAVKAIIERADWGDVAKPGTSKKERRRVLHFKGWKKGLVMGAACNRKFLAKVYPATDTADWAGKPIYLYVDPTATYGGQQVGGIRLALGDAYSGAIPPPKPCPVPRESSPGQADPDPTIEAAPVEREPGEEG